MVNTHNSVINTSLSMIFHPYHDYGFLFYFSVPNHRLPIRTVDRTGARHPSDIPFSSFRIDKFIDGLIAIH